jgi:hypothetical protein
MVQDRNIMESAFILPPGIVIFVMLLAERIEIQNSKFKIQN